MARPAVRFLPAVCMLWLCVTAESRKTVRKRERVTVGLRENTADITGSQHLRELFQARNLIPKVLHQTYKAYEMTDDLEQKVNTWLTKNPGWELRLYNDTDSLELFERRFPQWAGAYKGLAKHVERADFFRYAVVLAEGGFYADVDTSCEKPFDELVRPEDQLIVGWEGEWISAQETERVAFARQRQVLQWLFGGVAGHPMLHDVCERIASTVDQVFSNDTNMDTMLRTGPGLFTDKVLEHSRKHPPRDNRHAYIRVLPGTVWGNWAWGFPDLDQSSTRYSHHHFSGSWKAQDTSMPNERRAEDDQIRANYAEQLFPVSMDWEPSFTMLLPILGQADKLSNMDLPSMLSGWGSWNYPTFLVKQPSAAEALLEHLSQPTAHDQILLDIGAGLGYFSLAAAALGRSTISVELIARSAASFRASIQHNGFENLTTFHQAAVGPPSEICTDLPAGHKEATAALRLDVNRGYGWPGLHVASESCRNLSTRIPMETLVPQDSNVGAIRIAASGWEGWLLKSLGEVMKRSQTSTVMIELQPELVAGSGYEGGAQRMFEQMIIWGYHDIMHTGYHCVQHGQRAQLPAPEREPGWCKLDSESIAEMITAGDQLQPELVVFKRIEGSES